jgi:hypothetical protein
MIAASFLGNVYKTCWLPLSKKWPHYVRKDTFSTFRCFLANNLGMVSGENGKRFHLEVAFLMENFYQEMLVVHFPHLHTCSRM